MSTTVTDYDYWFEGAPLLDNGDPNMELWNGNSPLLDGPTEQQGQTSVRRRSFVIQQIYGND